MKNITPYDKDIILFYKATKISFCLFDNSFKALLRYPLIDSMECSPKNLKHYCGILEREASDGSHKPVLMVSGSCFLVLIRLNQQYNIMLGPVSSLPLSYREFLKYNKSIPDPSDFLHLYRVIQKTPLLSLGQFAENVSLFLKLVLQVDMDAPEILGRICGVKKAETTAQRKFSKIQKFGSIKETIAFQKKVLYYIKNGNSEKVEEIFSQDNFFQKMQLYPDTLEVMQCFFFSYVLICCVAVLEEGFSNEKVIPIFDSYISRIPSIDSLSVLFGMCKQISMDYCHLIQSMKKLSTSSHVLSECLQYIQDHIQMKITLNDLATHCNTSMRTINRQFEKYYHTSPSKYIMNEKLKKAVFLLKHSQKSMSEISNQLSFSSQSHFIVAFKKRYLCTPQQYRFQNNTIKKE